MSDEARWTSGGEGESNILRLQRRSAPSCKAQHLDSTGCAFG